jgi:hypothetical protein
MSDLLVDFNADARDRVWKLLEISNISQRDRLKASANAAGEQLEWLKPSQAARLLPNYRRAALERMYDPATRVADKLS